MELRPRRLPTQLGDPQPPTPTLFRHPRADDHRRTSVFLSHRFEWIKVHPIAVASNFLPASSRRIANWRKRSKLERLKSTFRVKRRSSPDSHAVNFITSGKAETAEQVSKALQHITNQPVTPQTVCRHLRRTGMRQW